MTAQSFINVGVIDISIQSPQDALMLGTSHQCVSSTPYFTDKEEGTQSGYMTHPQIILHHVRLQGLEPHSLGPS